MVPKHEFFPLNDKDVISIGGNYNSIQASGDKKIFLYQINAPLNYDSGNTKSEGTLTFFSSLFYVYKDTLMKCTYI